ncbi:profilin [Salvia divinorum]|uniref:Profilin n=1 Tax=Salvia divinorum TaxID=28513 RepID=A0ABD1HA51_SALDI
MKKTWMQPYVDDHLMVESNGVQLTSAAIISHHYGAVWAQSANFPWFSVEEIDEILEEFKKPGKLVQTGLSLGGTKYIVIPGEQRDVIRGVRGSYGITVKKTNRVLLVGIHNQWLALAQCSELLEKTANLLIKEGF